MDIKPIIDSITGIVATLTFVVGAVSAKRSWDEKRRDIQRTQMERRQGELRRLMDAFEGQASIFNEIFDYESDLDAHLRLTNLDTDFTDEEVGTRTLVDQAFEHLRDLQRSLRLGLIEADDLSFWTYWIHRIRQRPPLAAYARACGYDSFLAPLREATVQDPQLRELQAHCPWWPGSDADPRIRVDAPRHGSRPAGDKGSAELETARNSVESSDVRSSLTANEVTESKGRREG